MMRHAIALAASMSSSGATTWLTSPQRSASSASTARPVSIISIARARGIRFGSRSIAAGVGDEARA